MNCEDFEALLADALGDELSNTTRSEFDAHRAQCASCSREYESLSGSIESLRLLPGSGNPSRRLQPARTFARAKARGSDVGTVVEGRRIESPRSQGPGLPTPSTYPHQWFSHAAFRYAASVLIAFVAGYALHAGLMIGVTPPSNTMRVKGDGGDPSRRLQPARTFARAKARGSDVGKAIEGRKIESPRSKGPGPPVMQAVGPASSRSGESPKARPTQPRTTLEQAVANAHARKPGRSDLAKCLIALFPAPR